MRAWTGAGRTGAMTRVGGGGVESLRSKGSPVARTTGAPAAGQPLPRGGGGPGLPRQGPALQATRVGSAGQQPPRLPPGPLRPPGLYRGDARPEGRAAPARSGGDRNRNWPGPRLGPRRRRAGPRPCGQRARRHPAPSGRTAGLRGRRDAGPRGLLPPRAPAMLPGHSMRRRPGARSRRAGVPGGCDVGSRLVSPTPEGAPGAGAEAALRGAHAPPSGRRRRRSPQAPARCAAGSEPEAPGGPRPLTGSGCGGRGPGDDRP